MALEEKKQFSDLINAAMFIAIIFIVGGSTFLMPKQSISTYEKRELAKFPALNKESFFSGSYFKDIDAYYADNFMFRISITEIDKEIKSAFGVRNEGVTLYADGATSKKEGAIPISQEKPDASLLTDADAPNPVQLSASSQSDGKSNLPPASNPAISNTDNNSGGFQNIKSIIVYQNRAIQMFGGSERAIKSYAQLANQYKEELGSNVKVYVMAIPSGSDFFLPPQIKKNIDREKHNIDILNASLSPAVISVRAYENISKHTEEYIQFNTDHHWTGLGAYYAYQAFCKSANISALELSEFEKKTIPNFLGTLYYRTLSNELKQNPDHVDYYMVPHQTQAQYYLKGSSKPISGKTYVEFAKGSNAYGIFLGGDFPLMKIVTDVKNGKKIAIIKDSYGNAFTPYLASHYEEVYVMDYRYFNGNIKSLMRDNNINEIILAHNTFMLNSAFTLSRERAMLHSADSSKSIETQAQLAN
jgi:hypothetical protein